MDSPRFDALTRSLATAKSRRGLLGSLAALGAGLIGARAVDAQQVSQVYCGNQFCASYPGGCKPGCVCCVYTNAVTGQVINSRCRPPGTCSPGATVCPPGQVLGPSGGCAAPTTTTTTTTLPPLAGTCNPGQDACDGNPTGDRCNGTTTCLCIVSLGGVQVCAQFGLTCEEFPPCSADGDCAVGMYCARATGGNCCPTGVCLAPCSTPPAL